MPKKSTQARPPEYGAATGSDQVTIRRGLLVALILTASALCRKVNPERIAHCRDIFKKIDDEVFDPNKRIHES